jgi:hypothetical protein
VRLFFACRSAAQGTVVCARVDCECIDLLSSPMDTLHIVFGVAVVGVLLWAFLRAQSSGGKGKKDEGDQKWRTGQGQNIDPQLRNRQDTNACNKRCGEGGPCDGSEACCQPRNSRADGNVQRRRPANPSG